MTTLLAIETSSALCSLALYRSGRWFEDTQNVERMHNMLVLDMLDTLMKQAGSVAADIEAIAFAAGPGSFTGVRIAAALAQGIAFAVGARVVPVSSSLALATAALDQRTSDAWPEGILTITRSRRDAYYLAGFECRDGTLRQVMDDALHQGPPSQLPGPAWLAVGQRPEWWPASDASPELMEDCAVQAGTVGRLGLEAWDRAEALDAAAALPRYVSGDSPWRKSSG